MNFYFRRRHKEEITSGQEHTYRAKVGKRPTTPPTPPQRDTHGKATLSQSQKCLKNSSLFPLVHPPYRTKILQLSGQKWIQNHILSTWSMSYKIPQLFTFGTPNVTAQKSCNRPVKIGSIIIFYSALKKSLDSKHWFMFGFIVSVLSLGMSSL